MCGKDIECNSCGKKPNHSDQRKDGNKGCGRESGKGCECRRCKKENKCEELPVLIDCNKPQPCYETPKDECHKRCDKKCDKRCETKCEKKHEKRCRHKHACSCEEKIECDEDCDMKIKISREHNRGKIEAISLVGGDEAIIIPSNIVDLTRFVPYRTLFGGLYNFECSGKSKQLVLETNCITYGRVTDATDVDECGNFWFLAVECSTVKEEKEQLITNDPNANIQIVAPNMRSCVALIKAHYNACTNSVRLLSKFIIPTTCGCAGMSSCPSFEGLVQVACNDFFLFSDGGFTSTNGTVSTGHGVLFVSIKDNVARSYPVSLEVNDKKLCGQSYDSMRISTAFNVENGVVFVPQHPEKQCDFVFKITNRDIRRIKREIDCSKKCVHLCIEACVMTLCIKMTNPCRHDPMIVPVDPFDKYTVYAGIEAMTSNNCGELFGTTSWVYLIYILKGDQEAAMAEVTEDMKPYVRVVDVIPDDYEPKFAGFHARPFTGKINCK